MTLHRRNPRRDASEASIIEALEAQGFVVLQHSGTGEPDLVVFQRRTGRAWLIEIKAKGGTYTPAQVRWRQQWTGPAPITLRSVDDAIRFALLAMEGGSLSAVDQPQEGAQA